MPHPSLNEFKRKVTRKVENFHMPGRTYRKPKYFSRKVLSRVINLVGEIANTKVKDALKMFYSLPRFRFLSGDLAYDLCDLCHLRPEMIFLVKP